MSLLHELLTIKIPTRFDITVIARASAEFPPASCIEKFKSLLTQMHKMHDIATMTNKDWHTLVRATPLDNVVGIQLNMASPVTKIYSNEILI